MTKPNRDITVREALAWSDKHRLLSDSEGVRVVHIKQLLEQALTTQREENESKMLTKQQVFEVIEEGIRHGALPNPNLFGKWLSVKRHNQVVLEMRGKTRNKLNELIHEG